MSLEKYWDYLLEIERDLDAFLYERQIHLSPVMYEIIFKLTASSYHYWLENRTVLAQSSPSTDGNTKVGSPSKGKGTESETKNDNLGVGVSPPSPPNISEKARKVRQGLYSNYDRHKKYVAYPKAFNALCKLCFDVGADLGKDNMTIWDSLEHIPDDKLVQWARDFEVFP